MSPESIRTELERIAREKLRFDGDLGAGELAEQLDSVQRLTFVVAVEDHFEICFEPEDEERIHGIQDMVKAIHEKLRGA